MAALPQKSIELASHLINLNESYDMDAVLIPVDRVSDIGASWIAL
jgi:hypothetical protein